MPTKRPPTSEAERRSLDEALQGVKPLADSDAARAPVAVRRRKARPAAGADAEAVVFELENIGERVEAVAPGIDRAILRKVRNGEYPRDARLDLHGCDSVRARALVHQARVEQVPQVADQDAVLDQHRALGGRAFVVHAEQPSYWH